MEEEFDDVVPTSDEVGEISKTGLMVVSGHYAKSGQPVRDLDEECVQLKERHFRVPPAHATVSIGLTHNLGNYESLKANVSVTLPCYTGEIEQALAEAQVLVEEKIGSLSEYARAYQAFVRSYNKGGSRG